MDLAYDFKYSYDNKNRISNISYDFSPYDEKLQFNCKIEYVGDTQKISKITKELKSGKNDSSSMATLNEGDYTEIVYTYNSNGDIKKIDCAKYNYEEDRNSKYLFQDNIYDFEYNSYADNIVTIKKTYKRIKFKLDKDYNIIKNGYSQKTEYTVSGMKDNLIIGKNSYEEFLSTILASSILARSNAEIINGTNIAKYSEYIMYPHNITTYTDNKKDKEYTYTYQENNYLNSCSNITDNEQKQYFYKYLNDRMGKFEGTAVNNYLVEEFTLENNQIIKKENVIINRLTPENIGTIKLEDLGKEYESDLDVPVSSEDAYIDTFYDNSYYMYVYLTDEKVKQGNFMEDLKLIGGIYNMGQEKGKWTLYVKKDVYDRVYNKIQSIDGVKSIERTKTIVKQEDVNKIDVDSTNKYLMQIWGKDTKFMRREFYNFCQQYRRNNLFV